MKQPIQAPISEIKKVLYKEKPTAHRIFIGYDFYQYFADTSMGKIYFEVPIVDMGETIFGVTEPAQLLIRYIK